MDENNTENQPAPVEAAAADRVLPEQRQPRGRRRFRRRYREHRSDNFSDGTAEESTEVMDRQSQEGATENGEPVQTEPEFGEGIIEISGKGFGFLRDPKRNFVQAPQDIF